MTETLQLIAQQIADNVVILYMKGTPDFPMCGFSSQVAQILIQAKVNFSYVNVLEHLNIREELPKYASWPTFPQLYINKEFIGGCDIVNKLLKSGELVNKFEEAGLVDPVESKFIEA